MELHEQLGLMLIAIEGAWAAGRVDEVTYRDRLSLIQTEAREEGLKLYTNPETTLETYTILEEHENGL